MKKVRERFEDAVHQLFRMAIPFLMLFVSFILTSEVATLISGAAGLETWTTVIIMVVMSAGFVGMSIMAANGVVRWASVWMLWRQGMADKPDTTEVLVGGLFFAAYVSAVGGILWALDLERSAWVAVLAFEMLNIGMAFVVGYGNVRDEVKARLTLDDVLKLVADAKTRLGNARERTEEAGTLLALLDTRVNEAETNLALVSSEAGDVERRAAKLERAETVLERRAAKLEQAETVLERRAAKLEQAETVLERRATELAIMETAMERMDGLHLDVVRYIGGSGEAMGTIAGRHDVVKSTVSRLAKKIGGKEGA